MAEFDYEVVDGRKIRVRPQEVVSEIDENGYFVRQPNHFTEGFGEGKNPVEKGRYHLVWAKLCHWSNRASIVRELLGLEDAISVNMVDHAKHEKNLGWEFVYDKEHIDPVLGIQFLSEAYYKADDDYTGRTTVPALIDTKTGKVVNNDYTWLTNYFEVDFKPFHKKGAPDLYPEELRKDIDEMNDWLFDNINNGVYKATFARSKEAYWDAYNSFYAAMDILEKRLENQRFLFGDYVTDSDVRLYVTLGDSTTALRLRLITATPCVARVVLAASCAVENTSTRPSVARTAICFSSGRSITALIGLLSEYAPVSRLRLDLVS